MANCRVLKPRRRRLRSTMRSTMRPLAMSRGREREPHELGGVAELAVVLGDQANAEDGRGGVDPVDQHAPQLERQPRAAPVAVQAADFDRHQVHQQRGGADDGEAGQVRRRR